MGLLGIGTFIYLLFTLIKQARRVTTPAAAPLLLIIVLLCLLPFSYILQATFFLLIALFAITQRQIGRPGYFDVELRLVALKNGMFLRPVAYEYINGEQVLQKNASPKFGLPSVLPITTCIIILLFVAGVGFFAYTYVTSDLLMQQSLVAAAANNGLQTYNSQTLALQTLVS